MFPKVPDFFWYPITVPNLTRWQHGSFLRNITSIGSDFLLGCTSFNQPLTIPNNITSIGDNFLYGCTSFNQPITIPESITSIGKSFMYSNESYVSVITIDCNISCFVISEETLSTENIDADSYKIGISIIIDDSFKNEFNEKFPSYFSAIYLRNLILVQSFLKYERNNLGGYTVRTDFSDSMYERTEFNLHVNIPTMYNNLTVNAIGNNFLAGCTSYNQPITIPDSITSIGAFFLSGC